MQIIFSKSLNRGLGASTLTANQPEKIFGLALMPTIVEKICDSKKSLRDLDYFNLFLRMQNMTVRDPIQVFERLRNIVFPAVEEYWRGDAVVATFLDQHLSYDTRVSGQETCWKAALGALFGPKVVGRIASFHDTPWMNRTSMERALKELNVTCRKVRGALPAGGIALVQWEGVPNASNYRGSNLIHTHWIAVVGTHVFDVNWPAWIPLKNWEELVVVDALSIKRATGWSVLTGFEIS